MSNVKEKQLLPNFSLFEERADILGQLFSDDDINSLGRFIVECSDDISIMDSEITVPEKCRIVLDDIEVNKEKIDPLSVAVDATKQFDFHDLYLKSFSPQVEALAESDTEPIKDYNFFLNSEFFNRFCLYEKLNGDEIKSLSDYCMNSYTEDGGDKVPSCLSDENRFKSFVIFSTAANIEKELEKTESTKKSNSLKRLRIAYKVVERVKNIYELWESSVGDVVKQEEMALSYEFFKQFKSDLEIRQLILLLFVVYYKTYSDNWREFCFEIELPKRCNNPMNTLSFINQLKKHEYGMDYCLEYIDYVSKKGIKPLFNSNIIIGEKTKVTIDKDKSHKNWFEQIHKSKVKNGNDEELFKAVRILFHKLKDNGDISESTPESLFVYRFTGFLIPNSPEYKIEWTRDKKNPLAYIIKCLFTRKDGATDIVKPPYKKVLSFFSPQMSNGTSLADSLDALQKPKIVAMLNECGFVNVDPSRIK